MAKHFRELRILLLHFESSIHSLVQNVVHTKNVYYCFTFVTAMHQVRNCHLPQNDHDFRQTVRELLFR